MSSIHVMMSEIEKRIPVLQETPCNIEYNVRVCPVSNAVF